MELANLILEGISLGVLVWVAFRLGGIGKTVEFLERNCPLLTRRNKRRGENKDK